MKTSVNLAGVELKNPVMTASGTFGSGAEYSEFVDLKELGAVVTKGVANVPWPGNPTPRIAEVYGGMLNAIGLQNPGIDVFCERDIPFLKQFDTKIVVNVCGRTTEDYCEVVERLTSEPVDLLEINISCPNVKEGGIAFGQDPKAVEAITREVKKYAKQPIIMKLSPNVTDITEMARAAEAGGADVLSLINTLTGMKIDIERQKFAIANKTGGMSGPAVKPIAVRMVYQVAQAVKVPIIGMGGIASAEDALEFILAGATAVSKTWEISFQASSAVVSAALAGRQIPTVPAGVTTPMPAPSSPLRRRPRAARRPSPIPKSTPATSATAPARRRAPPPRPASTAMAPARCASASARPLGWCSPPRPATAAAAPAKLWRPPAKPATARAGCAATRASR